MAVRRAARLIVIDPTDRAVLLFQYEDAGRTWWATPGGGLEDDEEFEDAASREAAEELGARSPTLSPLWERSVEFTFRGVPIQQLERYFLIHQSRSDLMLGPDLQEVHAAEGIIAIRWWCLDEIDATSEQVYPQDLADRLRDIANREP